MSATASVSVGRDARVMALIGVAHGSSHYYQLAFVTMLLIVRDRIGLSFEQVGFLGALFYAVSGFGQTAAGFAVDRFGARPILAGGLLVLGVSLGLFAFVHSFAGFAAIAVLGGLGNSVFHPADFALLNASIDQKRLGRAFSIHGLGGSLGWAAGPAMYFLDGAVGPVNTALAWRHPRPRAVGAGLGTSRLVDRPSYQGTCGRGAVRRRGRSSFSRRSCSASSSSRWSRRTPSASSSSPCRPSSRCSA